VTNKGSDDSGKSDAVILELWLKLRSATDQKTYWFVAAVAAAVVGILSQWRVVYCAGGSAKVVFAVLALGALISGGLMTVGNYYDSVRLNELTGRITGNLGNKLKVWNRAGGATWGPLVTGLLFAVLMGLLGCRVTADPKQDPVCISKEKGTARAERGAAATYRSGML